MVGPRMGGLEVLSKAVGQHGCELRVLLDVVEAHAPDRLGLFRPIPAGAGRMVRRRGPRCREHGFGRQVERHTAAEKARHASELGRVDSASPGPWYVMAARRAATSRG